MSTEPRQWYKNSERPVTEADVPFAYTAAGWNGIVWHWPGTLNEGEIIQWARLSSLVGAPDITFPPQPREKSQAEEDLELWASMWPQCANVSDYAAAIRADQEAKTKAAIEEAYCIGLKLGRSGEREHLGRLVEDWIQHSSHHPFRDLRAIFATKESNTTKEPSAPTTKQEDTRNG